MSLISRHLPDALEWRYGAVADTAGEAITAWRHPTEPRPADLAALVNDYLAARESDRPRREAIDRGDAILARLRDAYAAQGDSLAEVHARLLYQLIGRISAGNRTPAMADYVTKVEAAQAAVQALRRA